MSDTIPAGEQGAVCRAAIRAIKSVMSAEHETKYKAYYYATKGAEHHIRKGARHALSALMSIEGDSKGDDAMYHLGRAVTRLCMAFACQECDEKNNDDESV